MLTGMESGADTSKQIGSIDIDNDSFLTEDLIKRMLMDYFENGMSVEKIIVTDNFKRELIRQLREEEKAKYLKALILFPTAETIIPVKSSEGFSIIMDSTAYNEEFTSILGLMHELIHVRDFGLYFNKYGYVHTKPMKFLRRIHYPEFMIWSEYIATKNSFEYSIDLYSKLNPNTSIDLKVPIDIPGMYSTYEEMLEQEKKDPRFADAVKLETSILLERFLKQYFASNLAKIELNNNLFKMQAGQGDLEAELVLELDQYIFESELIELSELLLESVNFEAVENNMKKMSKCHNKILDKLKRLV